MSILGLEMFAYAKVNLALAITGIRGDGFHELQTVMQSITLADRITIRRQGTNLECRCGSLSGPDNLAYRAAALFQERTGINEGIVIEIEKQIPVQAGLGGGSSDAATVLVGLNQLFDRPLSEAEIVDLAGRLGSDVPFCLHGGTKWAEGKGERLTDLPEAPKASVVVVKPVRGVNTALAYKRFDEQQQFSRLDFERWRRSLASGDIQNIIPLLHNDLEAPSITIVPEIQEIKQHLSALGCLGVLMSGSGSAVFGIAQDSEHAEYIKREFGRRIAMEYQIFITGFQAKYYL